MHLCTHWIFELMVFTKMHIHNHFIHIWRYIFELIFGKTRASHKFAIMSVKNVCSKMHLRILKIIVIFHDRGTPLRLKSAIHSYCLDIKSLDLIFRCSLYGVSGIHNVFFIKLVKDMCVCTSYWIYSLNNLI